MLKALADAMAKDLRNRYGLDAVEVTGYEEKTESTGYCETCYYEYAVIDITYVDRFGAVQVVRQNESFAEYVTYLTD